MPKCIACEKVVASAELSRRRCKDRKSCSERAAKKVLLGAR